MNNTQRLKKRFETICNTYVALFCKKHDFEFERWVADDVGGTAECGDYYISFDEIRYDIDNDIPVSIYMKYYDYCLAVYSVLPNIRHAVNYPSYCKGARPYTDAQLFKLSEARKRLELTKAELEKLIDEYVNN